MTTEVLTAVEEEGHSLSLRQLLVLFFAALVLFCALRWNSDQWLQQQLLPRLAGYGVHATAVVRDGGSLRLDNMTIDGVEFEGKALQLQQLVVVPQWLSLLKMKPAAQVSMHWQQAMLNAELERLEGNRLAIRGLKVSMPLSMLAPLLPAMPVTLAGEVMCHGALQWNLVQSLPEQPDIVCDWQQATASMGGKPMPLGHYKLSVRSEGADWHWTLAGGDVAKVEGKGMVHVAADHPLLQWPLDGTLTVRAGQGPLGAMVGGLLGTNAHAISGTLGVPVFR